MRKILPMASFKSKMVTHQILWKNNHLPHIAKHGWQNGKQYSHILPKVNQEENFFKPIQKELFYPNYRYLKQKRFKPHSGVHNLLSSWALCAKMYWPFNNPEGKILLARYFKTQANLEIETIQSVELEYEDKSLALKPAILLCEDNNGTRGSGQTSPDLAILFKTKKGEDGILLIECKFTEHSFYSCSGYKKQNPSGRVPNPDNKRCLDAKGILVSDYANCHLISWERKYWDLLGRDLDKVKFSSLSRCPMSSCCYQLFRQQTLAKRLQKKYSIVASCVAMNERNSTLIYSGNRTGLIPFPRGWQELFQIPPFYLLTHQAWFEYMKAHNHRERWDEWIEFVGERYFPS